MSLRSIELTSALRPSLLLDETLLFVQDAVGLYGGKSKLAEYQNGHVYVTSHRVCYVDNSQPRERAVAVNLKEVERTELSPGFLKSSAKVTLIPKAARLGPSSVRDAASPQPTPRSSGTASPLRSSFTPAPASQPINATWICTICSFSNAVPTNFDPATANAGTILPACQACGIKPQLIHVVKAAVASLSGESRQGLRGDNPVQASISDQTGDPVVLRCPRCTFQNHPSLHSCEICGASLGNDDSRRNSRLSTPPSASPSLSADATFGLPNTAAAEAVKFSFRAGGERAFLERVKEALVQRKWLLQSAPRLPNDEPKASVNGQPRQGQSNIGIAGLERRGIDLRKNNEVLIGNAFEDLDALMASSREIVALADEFARSQAQSNNDRLPDGTPASSDPSALLAQLNLITTKEMLSGSGAAGRNLYLTELSRSIAEFLTDDTRGVLKSAGGVISLVDLWAMFNRARGGVELVSPLDFSAATEMFESLSLPVRQRQFKSGLLVVQERSRTDEKTVRALLEWLRLVRDGLEGDLPWNYEVYGKGVTVQETAEVFGWSLGVATEELEMAEGMGALCRESGLEGTKWWENWLVRDVPEGF